MVKNRRNSFSVPSLPPLGSSSNPITKKTNDRRPPLPPGHFLRDVNLDGNLLDIPDPPSPPKRSARRQSSPLLLPRPLRDVTNADSDTEQSQSVATTAGKRSRKSLCHVPSPVAETDETESVNSHSKASPVKNASKSDKKEQVTTPATSSSLESVICFDDEDIVVSSSKRQKRRESMILPSDMTPLPMEEVSDDSLNDADSKDMNAGTALELEDDDNNVVMSSKRPSKRLSIILPSDIASFQEEVASKVFGQDK